MPRAIIQDYLNKFRFIVTIEEPNWADSILKTSISDGRFQNVPLPELTLEEGTLAEGNSMFEHKQAGRPTINSPLTFTRGVILRDGGLAKWIARVIYGEEYRVTLSIYQFHRAGFPKSYVKGESLNTNSFDLQNGTYRKWTLYQAFPQRWKGSDDLDATASDMALEEIDVGFEDFDVVDYINGEEFPLLKV